MANQKAIDRDYLLTQLQNFTAEILAQYFVQAERGKSLISNEELSQITANTLAIEDMQQNPGVNTTEVEKIVDKKLLDVIADAPDSFDTLKEISDWISSHGNSAAAMNTEIKGKADTFTYDHETGVFELKAGDRTLESTVIQTSGGNSNFIVFPEFEMDFETGHISAMGGAGVEFSINESGHLESEVL